jgi:hypothetical protein
MKGFNDFLNSVSRWRWLMSGLNILGWRLKCNVLFDGTELVGCRMTHQLCLSWRTNSGADIMRAKLKDNTVNIFHPVESSKRYIWFLNIDFTGPAICSNSSCTLGDDVSYPSRCYIQKFLFGSIEVRWTGEMVTWCHLPGGELHSGRDDKCGEFCQGCPDSQTFRSVAELGSSQRLTSQGEMSVGNRRLHRLWPSLRAAHRSWRR